MREAVQRRLSVEASELLTPLPLSFPLGVSSSVPQRFVTVNWGPTASCQHRSRGLRHRQGRNLNCSATRKCSQPVDGRRPQTFDPPGRLLGSAAQDLLALPATFGDRACCLQTTAPSETARPIAAGCRSVGGMARSSAHGLHRAYRTVASKGRSNPFAAVGAGRFRPAIGPPQSATAQTAVPRRWRAAAATADPACNVIPAQPGRAAPHACPGQPLSDQTHHWIRMRSEHRCG